MDEITKIMSVFVIGLGLFLVLVVFVVVTQDQAYNNFCQTKLVYSNSERWCLNEDDGKLYAIGCESVSFDGRPIDCYYKTNLVKDAG